jgi:hypothetical protein
MVLFSSVLFFLQNCPAFLDSTVFVYLNNAVRKANSILNVVYGIYISVLSH